LLIFSSARGSAAGEAENMTLRFNGDSGANYDAERLNAVGGTVASSAARATTIPFIGLMEGANSRNNNFSPTFAIVWNYNVATLERWAAGISSAYGNVSADADCVVSLRSIRWRNTNVITSITMLPETSINFVSGSHFQLYGIL
jgi:hypothetical protein